MIKVLLVDDHELVRIGIRRLLESAEDIEVVAESESGEARAGQGQSPSGAAQEHPEGHHGEERAAVLAGGLG